MYLLPDVNLPNLTKSRHEVYYLRLQRNGVDCRVSLRTKNFTDVRQLALLFNFHMSKHPLIRGIDLEALKKEARWLGIKLPNGIEINNIRTAEEMLLVRVLIQNYERSR
ncbi:hypothetical protein BPMI_01782 [Candidatus Burkholderia pumila]|uniref:Uncharacterized protein n=1 Tax=Candidatus Burkholderia pumila TaxID=1090375 RepID=A0ABR5HPF6_9BURK|nr:hypothetical protein BPMI_01782 [Candidatus Burkholderia pumila]